MDIQTIIAQLKEKFGHGINVEKITEALKGVDLSKISFPEIVSKLHADGLLNNLGADVNGLKEKAGKMFGGIFGK